LALAEAERMYATGDYHIRPKASVAETDLGWENDVLQAFTWIRFARDSQAVAAEFGTKDNDEAAEE